MNGVQERSQQRENAWQEKVLTQGHALKELHRKLKGATLQLESLMIALDIPFKPL